MRAILQMSLAASPLILCIFAARAWLGTRVPAHAYLALWGLAVGRLLALVWLPMRGDALKPLLNRVYGGMFNVSQQAVLRLDSRVLFVVWLLGAMYVLCRTLSGHFENRAVWREALPMENETVRAWCAVHSGKRRIRVLRSELAGSPFSCGTLRPVIVLPNSMEQADPECLTQVLTHEETHLRCFHPLFRYLLLFACVVHWFNPLAWLMLNMAGRDMELASDAAVKRRLGPESTLDFAEMLKNMEEQRLGLATVQSLGASSLQERYCALVKPKKQSKMLLIAVLSVAILLFGIFIVVPKPSEEKSNWLGRHLQYEESLSEYSERIESTGYTGLNQKTF